MFTPSEEQKSKVLEGFEPETVAKEISEEHVREMMNLIESIPESKILLLYPRLHWKPILNKFGQRNQNDDCAPFQ